MLATALAFLMMPVTALVIVPVFVIVPVTVRVTAPVYLVDSDNSKGKHFRLDYLPSTRLR